MAVGKKKRAKPTLRDRLLRLHLRKLADLERRVGIRSRARRHHRRKPRKRGPMDDRG